MRIQQRKTRWRSLFLARQREIMSHRNMPQWNTSSVRDAFSSYPLTVDLCTTYLRQQPEKHSLVLMNSGECEFSCLCPLTWQDWKVHKYSNFVFYTLCKCLLWDFIYIYFVVHLLPTVKIQSDRRESEKNYTLLFNSLKSDALINNMLVQNFSNYFTENTLHVHYKDQQD